MNKKRFLGCLLLVNSLLSVSCGPPPVPTCTITWTCGNSYCAASEGAWSGTSTFTGTNDQAECIAWGWAFENSAGYPYNRVGSCNCTN